MCVRWVLECASVAGCRGMLLPLGVFLLRRCILCSGQQHEEVAVRKSRCTNGGDTTEY